MGQINTIAVSHGFISQHVSDGAVCVDATAGRGYDTAFLCGLTGKSGKVYAFDIQKEAVESTNELLAEKGFDNAEVILASHSEMDRYVSGEVDCIVFNFGWLPKGDHNIHTNADTSIAAIEKGLALLKDGGIMSLSIYYGRETGFEERDALLEYFKTIDADIYTVIVSEFVNRTNCYPISVFIIKG